MERAATQDEDAPQVIRARASICAGIGEYEQAERYYRHAIELDSTDHSAHIGLADLYWSQGELDSAEAVYRRAVSIKPLYWNGNLELGILLAFRGEQREAREIAERVRALPPVGYHSWNNLGALHYNLSDLDEARKCFEKSMDIRVNYPAAANLGTYYYIEEHDFETAAMYYKKAAELRPSSYIVWGNLATAQLQVPHLRDAGLVSCERAVRMIREYLRTNDRDPYAYAALAEYQANLDKALNAIANLRTAQDIAPDDSDVMASAVMIFATLDMVDSARVYLDSLEAIDYPLEILEKLPGLEDLFVTR